MQFVLNQILLMWIVLCVNPSRLIRVHFGSQFIKLGRVEKVFCCVTPAPACQGAKVVIQASERPYPFQTCSVLGIQPRQQEQDL
jgi:hypothetical protein